MIAFAILMAMAASEPAPRCSLQGWSNDTDPAGLRVRAAPSLSAHEIGRLPAAIDAEESYAPNFDIVDVRDGWVKIANADDVDNPGTPRPVFKGTGWVHGSRVVFSVQSEIGRVAPSIGSKVAVQTVDWITPAGGRDNPIVDCAGGWAKLRYRYPAAYPIVSGPRSGEAWFGGICGNQRTTCDGMNETKSRSGLSR